MSTAHQTAVAFALYATKLALRSAEDGGYRMDCLTTAAKALEGALTCVQADDKARKQVEEKTIRDAALALLDAGSDS